MFDWIGLLIIVAKSSVVYLFILGAIRLFGKKELAQLSVVDLVFILLISNSVQNAMVGSDNSLQGGIAAALGLFIVNYVLKTLSYRFSSVNKALQGESIMLIYEGKLLTEHCKKAMISKEEVEAAVREHGVKSIEDVNLAVLEVDGNISVVSDDFKKRTTRRRRAHKAIVKQQ
ncbi:MAG: DUF421 domain-containing protein [Bacteroidetes bacterium]|nr:DUF421 domain-containing protein [Bacteroidota bacterium]